MVPRAAVRATSNTCMSVDFADVNRDGAVDFFTADMLSPTRAARQRHIPTHTPLPKTIGASLDRAQWMRNMLQVGRGDGTWSQIADFAGVAATDWTWGSAFVDVDLDAYEDLLVVAGHRWDVRDADAYDRIRNAFPRVAWNREQGEFPRLKVPNVAFRNRGDLTFADMSREWRFGTDSAISHAIVLADFDGDGDVDPIVTRLGEPPVVYRNESSNPRIAVRLIGRKLNTGATGAVVTVRAPSLPVQSREVTVGGYYLSGSDALESFALGKDSSATLEVRWRDGRRSRIEGARPNRLYEIDEAAASDAESPNENGIVDSTGTALFSDATSALRGHSHVETAFEDYARQPLIPNRFSQLGPGISWIDVDRDGREDLVVGSGRGGRLSVLRNTPAGFVRADAAPTSGDIGTVLPLVRGNAVSLIASQANYEAASAADAVAIPRVLSYPAPAGRPGTPQTVIAGDSGSIGALSLGDVDGDGILDLFVGARVLPGAWPIPARSHLYRGQADGSFAADPTNDESIKGSALVTASTFADLNGDGLADLVVASEWGPVRVYLSEKGRLKDATSEMGLAEISSRWLGVAAGDFDGDGKLDLVATSWGRNIPWRASAAHPYALWVGRVDNALALLTAEYDSTTRAEMPTEGFSRVTVPLPNVRRRIGTYADYAKSDVATILGDAASSAVRVGATTFDHTLFLNRGTRFEARALPAASQMAPSSCPVVADFDGDGHEDLFLSQNFFPTEISTMRFDAGAGVVLLGDGSGGFNALSVRRSGVSVLGDQRGAATADYDNDARPDLAVSQNGTFTRLFRNVTGRPGVRVRLEGSAANPLAIGTQLRVMSKGRAGPLREVRAGTGYWSMDGSTSVLALPDGADSVWVRWPGGQTQTLPLVPGAREVRVKR
jgi:hypothetical protein